MKSFLLGLALILTIGVFAQAPVEFKMMKHNFGKIKQGVPVTTTFNFTNNSAKPVVIENATAECGCTSPEFPKGAIAKGKSGIIKVTYNAANPGAFTKKVNVKVAGVTDMVVLTIEGEVVNPTASGTPVKTKPDVKNMKLIKE